MHLPRIIAHRGASAVAPENTLAAFRAAAAAGAQWVEFDVALTSDGRPVVFHDDRLDRTSDGTGLLAETSFETLKHLDAGSWFAPTFAGEMIPTLEEVLETLETLALGFNMEIKPDLGREVATAHTALTITAADWPEASAPPLISSFSRIAVAVARDEQPQWPRSLLFDRRPLDWREIGQELKLTGFGANQQHLDRDQVAELKDAGFRLTAYTVNTVERAQILFAWGVDAVFTDTPGTMVPACATFGTGHQ
ncbi:MAG: glycerophosphodiester phosphodiesterase [Rhodospirillaceae bacterium]|nr:MAG: glycerophosphodiester phosphodiesterase [Rhodospirillaceae bacterium]